MDIALQNKNTNVNIYSDSLSALQSLSIPQMSVKVNDYILQIKKKIAEFYKNNIHDTCLKFTWMPAHKGIKGNEIADELLAKEATKKENTQQLVPFSDMKPLFKRIAIHASRNVIKQQGESKGKLYFKSFYKNSVHPWFHNKQMKRELIVTINRCRSGHYNLNASLFKINVVSQPNCECGYENQDLDHVLWNCSNFNAQRSDLLQKLARYNQLLPLDLKTFLVKPNVLIMTYIFELKKSELVI